MLDIEAYHGTNRNRGNIIIEEQKMKVSKGDKHWLGDGSYFFTFDFWAYWWIKELYKDKYLDDVYLDIYEHFLEEHYQILKVRISVNKERIFNLDNPLHKLEFMSVMNGMSSKEKESQKLDGHYKIEGVVINYMFNELGYSDEFDLVRADFIRDSNKYENSDLRLRLLYNSQHQICVKNVDIIHNIREYNYIKNILIYYKILDRLFVSKQSSSINYYNSVNNDNIYKI